MLKRGFLIGFSILLISVPVASWAANVPAKVYENGSNDAPIPQAGVKVEVFGGAGLKTLLSSSTSGADGGCTLKNVPLGKDILVKLTKSGYLTQYDIRAYSDTDVQEGAAFWIGLEDRVKGLYSSLGETLNATKGQVYLEINDELSGEGIEGIELAASSGNVFDLGRGEYLIANAEGASLKVALSKPGYAFDIESATIPLYSGGMTQYYINVQSGGAVFGGVQPLAVTSARLNGFIRTLSGGVLVPLSGVSVAFTFGRKGPAAATVTTNSLGEYSQTVPTRRFIKVTPSKTGFTFKPKSRLTSVPAGGKTLREFKAVR